MKTLPLSMWISTVTVLTLLQYVATQVLRCKIHTDETMTQCKECYSPYKPLSAGNYTGRCCHESCLGCQPDLGCVVCPEGTYYRGEQCVSCGSGCEQCGGPFGCKYCADGFFLNQSSRCQPCMPGCLKCKTQDKCMDCDARSGSRFYQKNKTAICEEI